MKRYKILQIGLGPLGIMIGKYIIEKESLETVAAVDINPKLEGKDFGNLISNNELGVSIKRHINEVENIAQIDVVLLTTSSSIKVISNQINDILDYSIPIVSTCEELSFPWKTDSEIAAQLNRKAIEKNVAILSTGVNPGFLMDTLPAVLTGVCKELNHVQVNRIQDARTRRVPFQKKIGAGLTKEEFETKKAEGSLRHVGLTESMHFIAETVGFEFDTTEDVICPIIAEEQIVTEHMTIPKGKAMGVRQIGRAMHNGEEKIKLVFEAAVGLGESYEEIIIKGKPNIHSKISGGVHGDIATCSIVLNAIPNVINANPGLRTMKDVGIVGFMK